jgi:phage-related tail fiber protein
MAVTINGTTGEISSAVPSGLIMFYGSSTLPSGYLKCNGAAISRTTYAALFAAIGTTFGVGDGSTTFNVPDMRGYFPRGWVDNGSVDSGRSFGSTQTDDLKAHTHTQTTSAVNNFNAGYGLVGGGSSWYTGPNSNASGSTGGTETRPYNVALLACIKF